MTADRIFPIGAVGRMTILFEQILESLFLGFIYSTPYSTTPQRYLTSFAMKRDFFHSFFGSEEDDLDRQSHCENARDDIAKTEDDDEVLGDADETTRIEDTEAGTVGLGRAEAQSPGQRLLTSGSLSDTRKEDEGDEEVLGDADDISRNEDTDAGTVSLDSPEAQSTGQRLLTSGNLSDTKEKDGGELHPSGSRPPMYEFGQQNHDGAVSLAEASRLLFKSRIGRKALFTVLSPIAGNRFRKRQADSLDNASMVAALELPSESRFIARDKSKRLKMTAPTTILDAARSQRLQAVLMVKQPSVQELIRQFDNHNATEEELDNIS